MHELYRRYIRNRMLRTRATKRGNTLCDLCGQNEGTERHHMVWKSATMSNELARLAAEVEPLSSWLCRECHLKADSPAVTQQLLGINEQLYGVSAVQDALNRVRALAPNLLLRREHGKREEPREEAGAEDL